MNFKWVEYMGDESNVVYICNNIRHAEYLFHEVIKTFEPDMINRLSFRLTFGEVNILFTSVAVNPNSLRGMRNTAIVFDPDTNLTTVTNSDEYFELRKLAHHCNQRLKQGKN